MANSKNSSKSNGKANPFNTDISAIDFVTAWQSSDNVDAVIEKTSMTRGAAYQRAASYRRKGVALKKMERKGRTGQDWSALNDLAQSIHSEALSLLEG